MQKSTKNPDDFITDRRAYTLYSTKYVDKMEKKEKLWEYDVYFNLRCTMYT